MLELGGGTGFPLEPLDELRVERQREGQHLHRHVALEVTVFRPEDQRHPPATQLLDDLVLGAERLADEVELGHRPCGQRLNRRGGREIETAGRAEFGGTAGLAAAAGAEHGPKLPRE